MAQNVHSSGTRAYMARNSQDAIRELGQGDYAMIIVDARLKMPPALAFLKKLKEVRPNLARGLYLGTEPQASAKGLAKKAGIAPCAVFGETIDADMIEAFLTEFQKESSEATIGAQIGLSADKSADLQLDYEAKDMVAEVQRVLNIMLDRPDLHFPIFPWAQGEIEKAINAGAGNLDALIHAGSVDAGIAARLMRDAIREKNAWHEPPVSIREAIDMLGVQAVLDRLKAWLEADIAQSRIESLQKRVGTLWLHSLATAYGNEMLAQRMLLSCTDHYYLAGLLHDIGKWAIVEGLEEGYKKALWTNRMVNDAFVDELMERYHCRMGAYLARKWGLTVDLAEAVEKHNSDAEVQACSEAVIITYFSNTLTQKIGCSIKEYDKESNPLNRDDICRALNINTETRQIMEDNMKAAVTQLRAEYALGA